MFNARRFCIASGSAGGSVRNAEGSERANLRGAKRCCRVAGDAVEHTAELERTECVGVSGSSLRFVSAHGQPKPSFVQKPDRAIEIARSGF